MTDNERAGGSAGSDDYPGTPRWVKMFGIGVLILALAVALIMHTVRGEHGPGRHTGSGQR